MLDKLASLGDALKLPWVRIILGLLAPLLIFALVLMGVDLGVVAAVAALVTVALLGLAILAPVEASLAYAVLLFLMAWHPELRNIVTFIGGIVLLAIVAAATRPLIAVSVAVVLSFAGSVDLENGRFLPSTPADFIAVLIFTLFGVILGLVFKEVRRRYVARERELEQAQEDERDRTALALHSSVAASLSSVIMRSEVLALDKNLSDQSRQDATSIANDARRAMQEVRDLIRLVGDGVVDRPVEGGVNLGEDMKSFLRELRNHGYRTEIDGELGKCAQSPSPKQFNLALRELATNITKYGDADEPVIVKLRCSRSTVTLETRNHIADRQTLRHMSTGLGLNDVRRIMHKIGGDYTYSTSSRQWHNTILMPLGKKATTLK